MIFESNVFKINLEDFDIYQLLYFNELLKYIFKNRKEIEEKRIKKEKYFIYYQIENLREFENIIKESNKLIDKCKLILSFNCNTFKELLIKIELENDKNNKIINLISNNIYNYLLDLKEKVKKSIYIENYFLESFQLSYGSFSNYYNFNYIELDFGKKQNSYPKPIIVKTKIKYKKILNEELKDFKFLVDTLDIDRDITLNLIQLFLRTNFEPITNGIYYNNQNENFLYNLDNTVNGNLIEYDRNNFIEFQDEAISNDIEHLFKYFEIMEYTEKSVFLQACEAYIEGLKNNKGKEIMFFIIALETLANYEYNNDQAKADKIYNLITQLYTRKIIGKDYINYIYDLRSLYSHQGISNNKIKQNIFNIYENNKKLICELEEITYSTLIKWLINKGEKYGR